MSPSLLVTLPTWKSRKTFVVVNEPSYARNPSNPAEGATKGFTNLTTPDVSLWFKTLILLSEISGPLNVSSIVRMLPL